MISSTHRLISIVSGMARIAPSTPNTQLQNISEQEYRQDGDIQSFLHQFRLEDVIRQVMDNDKTDKHDQGFGPAELDQSQSVSMGRKVSSSAGVRRP